MTPTAAFSPAVTRATTRLEPPTDHSFTVAVHPWDAAKWIGERIGLPAGMAGRVYERGPASYRVEVANGSDGAVQSLMDEEKGFSRLVVNAGSQVIDWYSRTPRSFTRADGVTNDGSLFNMEVRVPGSLTFWIKKTYRRRS